MTDFPANNQSEETVSEETTEYWGNMGAATVQNPTALAVVLEDARQRLCGYRTHFTKLMKEINQILSNESPSNLSKFQELVDLKSKAKAALDVYVAAVKKLGAENDDQEAEYLAEMSKMMKNFGSRFTAFVAAATEAGSGYSSSESSKPHSLSGSISSRKSISKSVKNAVDAEVNLALIRRTATLTLDALKKEQDIEKRRHQADQEEERLRLETKAGLEMVQAEAALERARAIVAAEKDILRVASVTIEDMAPEMSTQEKVSKYIQSTKNFFCDVCAEYVLQELDHLLFDCPASEPLRKSIFDFIFSIFDLWSRPWGVTRCFVSVVGLHRRHTLSLRRGSNN